MSGSIAGGAVLLLKLGEALVEHLRELLRFVQRQLFSEDVGFPFDGKVDAVSSHNPKLLLHGFQQGSRVGFGKTGGFDVFQHMRPGSAAFGAVVVAQF